jgi:capsular exopolysaccharide synthesis family protein
MSGRPEMTVRDILEMLWRRKTTIFGIILLSTIVTAIFLSTLTPTYTAAASVAMERRGIVIGNWDQVASGLPGDEPTFVSEIEIVRSRDLASRVVDRLNLTGNPEFNSALRKSSGWLLLVRDKLSLIGSSPKPLLTPEQRLERQRASTVSAFLQKLEVSAVGKSSRVMQIRFTSEDRELAALAANTVAEVYLESQVEIKIDAAKRANELLNEHVETLRQKVAESENAVEEFRQRSDLLKGKDVTLTGQKTAEVNSQLVLAEAALAEAEARYQQMENLMYSSGGIESAAEILGSELVKSLREQQSTVERNLAEFSAEYGPGHPKIIKLQAEIRDLKRTLQAEMNKIVKGYENEVEIARARREAMLRSMQNLERQVGAANSAEVELRSLEREARANQTILESFLMRFKETSAQQDLGIFTPDARVISHAHAPIDPSFPRTKLFIALVAVGSAFIGLLIVFLMENLDQRLRSAVEIEEELGVPLLALIPALKRSWRSKQSPASYVVENSGSAIAQSIRALQTGIDLCGLERTPKTILITSVQPTEGKTTISASLARIRAMAGARVIVIDADFHRPGIADALGVQEDCGFADVLAGKSKLEDVIREDEQTGASYITAGNVTPDSPSLLGSDATRRALDELWIMYDTVVIDSPPLMAVSDARILAGIADATILVVRWAHTERDIVRLGLRQILASGGRLAGIVLSQVDVRKNSKYRYPDSGAYSGALSYYYKK